MKNNKIILIGIILVLLTLFAIFIPKNNMANDKLVEEASKNAKKKVTDYKKITSNLVLNEDTCFRNYAFINNNSIYIFNPDKLDEGIFEYKKVYDIKNDIKAMNITPDYGSDIRFIDYNDMLYTLKDINSDNKIRNSYDMYLNANYELSPYLKWEYSKEFLGKKIDYDFMSNYVYVKDNILYRLNYTNNKYPTITKVDGNYEGEKVIRIYNERILKTDKAFYEIVSYFDNNLNKTITTTIKINLLTKYYNDVLTFTYKYVILKDYTLIPINDVMINRANDYQYNEFISSFNSIKEVPKVFEE
ncbi:unknown [Mycoplasma sp. CAG:611]|nr:unknown [Mycoplasma sp. CAG:611]